MVTRKRIKTVFQVRRATEAEWIEHNPILALGEPAYSYDIQRLKIGNGQSHWEDLRYLDSEQEIEQIIEKLNNLHMSDIKDSDDYATKQYVDDKFEEQLLIDCGTSTTVL